MKHVIKFRRDEDNQVCIRCENYQLVKNRFQILKGKTVEYQYVFSDNELDKIGAIFAESEELKKLNQQEKEN